MSKTCLNKFTNLAGITLILVCLLIPMISAYAGGVTIAGDRLPDNAVLYYDNNGNLIGAKVDDPNAPETIKPDNPFSVEKNLPQVEYRRNGKGIDVNFIDYGTLTSTRYISYEELVLYYGSSEKVDNILNQLDRYQEESQEVNPIEIPDDTPGPIGPFGYWHLDSEISFLETYTSIGQIYSAPFLETHLRLKMTTGSKSVSSINGGFLTYGEEVQFSSSSVTDYYVSSAQTRTIQYMFDYMYEGWQWYTLWGVPTGETREYWYPTQFRSLSGRLYSPYPSPYKTKTVSDNTLTLSSGEQRSLIYDSLTVKTFGVEAGANLDSLFIMYKYAVPIVSFSNLNGKYSGSEAVYYLYNPSSRYREWYVYEWGAVSGTSKGWVCSFYLKL